MFNRKATTITERMEEMMGAMVFLITASGPVYILWTLGGSSIAPFI